MSEIRKKLKKIKNTIDPYQKKFFAWCKKNENIKEFKKFIEPYQKKSFAWYKKSKRNKNIVRIGGAIFILILGKGILGGGAITIETTRGYKITIERKNIFCNRVFGGMECTTNGISKDLTGNKRPFSQTKLCELLDANDKVIRPEDNEYLPGFDLIADNRDTITCIAAKKKGLI